MILDLLNTIGNDEVFFQLQEDHEHPFYDTVSVSEPYFSTLIDSKANQTAPVFSRMSYGQTRDFINAVADELGEK